MPTVAEVKKFIAENEFDSSENTFDVIMNPDVYYKMKVAVARAEYYSNAHRIRWERRLWNPPETPCKRFEKESIP